MANPYRGEVDLEVNGETRTLRLTLGALAALEESLESDSLFEMISRFETGNFRVRDLIGLLTAGLNGGGLAITEAELLTCQIGGGPLAAARAAAKLLRITFTIPGETSE
ncbi:MAG: gene transfer agent family protein [Pseudomonadota bacterium]